MDMRVSAEAAASAGEKSRPAARPERSRFARRTLIDAIGKAAMVAHARSSIPILQTVMLGSVNGHLIARGTDLDTEITVDLGPAKRGGFVGCLQSPRALASILKGVVGDEIELSRKDGEVRIAGDGFNAKLTILPADHFPVFQCGPVGWQADLPRSVVDAILRVSGAASTEETRYYLNGVYLHHLDGWTWRAVATDGHRLYYTEIELPGAATNFPSLILPRRAVAVLAKLRDRKSEQPIQFAVCHAGSANTIAVGDWTGNPCPRVRFRLEGVEIATKTIDGTFPDYRRVIPPEEAVKHSFEASVDDLRRVIRALSFAAGAGAGAGAAERTPALKLSMRDERLFVGAKFAVIGFDGEMSIEAKISDAFEIGFNGHYLLGALDALKSQRVVFRMSAPAAPVTVHDPESSDFGIVLMPMRV